MSFRIRSRRSLCALLTMMSPALQADSHPEYALSELEDEIQWLQEEVFVTTATKTEEALAKSGSTISVITSQEIKAMGARTLYDVLKRLPGIGVSQFNMGMSAIEVRGVKTDFAEKVLFLMNGHPINNNLVNGGANSSYNEFIVDDIKHVEVVRGPGSALYGANALVAVVNIITNQAKDIQGTEVTVAGGSDDTKKLNVQFGHQLNDVSIAGNFHVSDTNGYDGTVLSDSIGQSGPADYWQERYEGGLNLQYGGWSGQARFVQRESGTYLGANNVLSNKSEQEYIDYFFEFGYQTEINRDMDIAVKAYFDHFEFDNTWELYPPGAVGNPDSFFARSPIKHDVTGVEGLFEYQLPYNHKLLLGTMFEHQSQYDVEFWSNGGSGPMVDISAVANWNGSQNRDVRAVFAQDIWDVQDNLRIIAGVRYDHYSDFGETVNPRASITWSVVDSLRIIASYGSAFRAPTFGELYNINNPSIVGNPDVQPEEITTYELGVRGEWAGRTQYGVTLFRNQIDDLIASAPTNTAVNTYDNVGELEVNGVELEVSTRLKDGSTLGANYTYQHPINEVTDERLADVPLHRANASFNYFVSRYMSLYAAALYKGETDRASGDTRTELDGYVTVDVALVTQDLWLKDLELKVSVYNLFDRNYYDPAPNVMLSDYPKNGQNFMLEATYNL